MTTTTRVNLSLPMLLLSFVASGCSETDSVEGKSPLLNVKSDERVVFFPTYGRFDADSKTWTFKVHGHIFEPENSSKKREAFIAIIRAADIDKGSGESKFLDERVMPFLVDNERGKVVAVDLAGGPYAVGQSEANGHFSKTFSSSAIDLNVKGADGGELKFAAVLEKRDNRRFAGRVHLISPEGLSVISDIDDTIKQSAVTDKSELIKNTFVRNFQAVEGMSELYESLHDSGAVFHYVSGSPWQLYEPLKVLHEGRVSRWLVPPEAVSAEGLQRTGTVEVAEEEQTFRDPTDVESIPETSVPALRRLGRTRPRNLRPTRPRTWADRRHFYSQRE